ncbi:MAG: hypothetical protein JO007_04350 [Alphaproteobacteria bacterium]|nr:hypothetical protein [Alphaproteobacteria bacterium]
MTPADFERLNSWLVEIVVALRPDWKWRDEGGRAALPRTGRLLRQPAKGAVALEIGRQGWRRVSADRVSSRL